MLEKGENVCDGFAVMPASDWQDKLERKFKEDFGSRL